MSRTSKAFPFSPSVINEPSSTNQTANKPQPFAANKTLRMYFWPLSLDFVY